MTKISWRNSSIVGATKRASNLFLERIQEKWVPVFRPNARQNKDSERIQEKHAPAKAGVGAGFPSECTTKQRLTAFSQFC